MSRSQIVAKGNRTRKYRKLFENKYDSAFGAKALIKYYNMNTTEMAQSAWKNFFSKQSLRTIKGNINRNGTYRDLLEKCNYGKLKPLKNSNNE